MTDTTASAPIPAPGTLAELHAAVTSAQAGDPFARVVIISDHPDAARAVSHWLGAQDSQQGKGLVNVTVQTGRRLASELAGPDIQPLPRPLEGPAVRLAAADDLRQRQHPFFDRAGERRYYRSLTEAFRRMSERPDTPNDPDTDTPSGSMNAQAEALYQKYRETVESKGYCIPSELPRRAADTVANGNARRLPSVIYYRPRRLSAGDTALQQALLAKERCQIIAPFTGDDPAAADAIIPLPNADRLSIIAAPDPDEEVRAVIRQIAAADIPFHRTAVIYRQSNPYDSLLRQHLDCARIPYAGTERRTLADTPTGRLLLGIVDLAAAGGNNGAVDRELLIKWMSTTLVRWADRQPAQGKSRPVPAHWVTLAREARANGSPKQWQRRLRAYIEHKFLPSDEESDGQSVTRRQREQQSADALYEFVKRLAERLRPLGSQHSDWQTASENLETAFQAYRWYDTESGAESDDDRQKIADLISGLAGLEQWQTEYDLSVLQEAVREGLQASVSERGKSVGAGIYLGPPAGIVGAAYDTVYVLGMVEGQFPPRPAISPWLADNPAERRREAALERYDFLAALAAASGRAVLCWPAATAERRAAYPSRWLVEAANRCHHAAGNAERLTYETITNNADQKPWLTVIASRAAGLRKLPKSNLQPADTDDYRLMHLSAEADRAGEGRAQVVAAHPAVKDDARMVNALAAGKARYHRNSIAITKWDGRVPANTATIAGIGSQNNPISPSALETWASCPYRYFLSRILRLSAPPEDDEDDTISALDKGSLVHKILERFANEGQSDFEQLRKLAEQEFQTAEERGVTGHHLLWEVTKEEILAGLRQFLDAEAKWFGDSAPVESKPEISFGPRRNNRATDLGEVRVAVDGLGEVWFRGKIDRLDELDSGEVRVRDFKTGKPEPYFDGAKGRKASRTVANGQALQLPVYLAAAKNEYQGGCITASYCFPLADSNVHDVAPYTDNDEEAFHAALSVIIDAARSGVFPATPDGDAERGNCRYCDFKRLCPTRRRQIWERKGSHDPAAAPYNHLGGKAAIKDGN